MLGTITGREITKNRDGDADRIMLQIKFLADGDFDDVRKVELMTQSGEDFNPADGSRVFVVDETDSYKLAISTSDDLTPEVKAGEKELYSTNNPVTTKLAKVKLTKDSEVVLNDGTDFAVRYSELETAFNQLQADFDDLVTLYNAHIHVTTATVGIGPVGVIAPTVSTGSPSTADITPSKIEKVLVP